ncbi:uncharacterized protein EAE98_010244 [Botrytis deweyae]|uniref:FAD/NAD(P)-binding domain-containing protein n=1 Tax=Botrytis deweyae TaxID=2478750 RepID=A0ABQ7I9I0_9HELO|nr:uncharacterized protein EAE98_010244 [Botrytis deweyae]KAF7917481.1 hypothetical protein EAE98_010244 [Botrytis deweyae]
MSQKITVDYLVIGAGAMGMAFVDTLFTDKPNATFAIVDRYSRPGGHWTKAYPFVRLHQPSTGYGVNSRALGENKIDMVGWNSGLAELATGDEILAYYTRVLTQQFLPSNRVTYYPLCEYTSDGEFHSTVTGKRYSVGNETRIVDTTFLRQKVPSMGPPSYIVADDVKLVTPNELVHVSRPFANYTVVGAGKTAIDACLWMLSMGIDPSKITWIMPRDSWFYDRKYLQPLDSPLQMPRKWAELQFEAVMAATSVDDMFQRQDASGALLRLSKNEWPTMFHCATITLPELEQIRKIEHIVRMGRVKHITADQVTLEGGKYTPVLDTLYINCTVDEPMGSGSAPVFNGKHITLQPLRACQQVFSAALIAHVEAEYDNDEKKNSLCAPVPHPNKPIDWLRIRLQEYENKVSWDADPKMVTWLSKSRLNLYRDLQPSLPEDREGRRLALQAFEERRAAYFNKLRKLYDDHETVNVKL